MKGTHTVPPPPAEIHGRLPRSASPELRARRHEWIAEQWSAGHLQRNIAAALGVTSGVVSRMIRHNQLRQSVVRRPQDRYLIASAGVRMGRGWQYFTTLPAAQRDLLIDRASANDTDVLDEVFDIVAEALAKEGIR